jgi:hypothetical protein
LSRFAISDLARERTRSGHLRPGRAHEISWQLAQTLWVGGLWMLHLLVLPGLARIGLAPLLIEEIGGVLMSLLVGVTAVGIAVQACVLVRLEHLSSLWRDLRGQLLLMVALMAASHFLVRHWWPDAGRWLLFSYLVMAFCGVLLVLQPIPVKRAG